MKESKLVEALKTLDKEELKAFRHFLGCKLFNRRERPILLFDYLKTELKKSNPKLDYNSVTAKVFSRKAYNKQEFLNLMSFLSTPLYKFLTFQKLHANPEDELLALCNAFRERKLFKLFEKTAQKAAYLQKHSSLRDSEYHYRNYRLEQELYYASTQKGRAEDTNLTEVTHNLDISYFTNRLRYSCYMLSHQNMYKKSYDFTQVNHILEEVKRRDLLHIPAISIYYYCYLAQVYPENVSYFKSLQQLLVTKADLFTIAEMKDIYLLAINTAIKRYNQGDRAVVPDLLELFQSGIDKRILLTNNILSRFTYKNIVTLAVTQKQFDWTAAFLKDYTNLLKEDYREVTYQYNLAKLYCEKKEFEEALKYLFLTNTSDDVYINIDTKILLARIYFEQGDTDAQIALSESFKKILSRKKEILGYHHISYKNFLNSVNKLTALNPFSKEDRAELLKEIIDLQPLPHKHWFLEQLEDNPG